MKPNPKNERFNQQHKIYEQGRRSQIAQLISSLHGCLPREYKPKKDNQTDILSSVLNFVEFLQAKSTAANGSVAQNDFRRELETSKAYVRELEERCNRFAKLLDAKGAGNEKSAACDSQSQPLPGSVSVIAASAPLVFLVSQHSQGAKLTIDAGTSTERIDPVRSEVYKKTCQDASVNTDVKRLVEATTETEERGNFGPDTVSVEVQVGPSDYCNRGCSPITFVAQAEVSNAVGTSENGKKRPSTTADTADNSAGSTDTASRNEKRRRSNDAAPSILEIVNLVASNELGTAEKSANSDVPNASGKKSSGRDVTASSLLSINALLQQQNLPGLPTAAVSVAPTGSVAQATAPQPVVTTVSSSWYSNFPSLDTTQQSYNRNSTQPRQNQQPSSNQHRQRQQQPSAPRDNVSRQPQNAPVYQSSSTEANHATYSTVTENQTSVGNRMNENCSKNSSSRRGANFSVEFLHGGGTNVDSGRLQQQDVHNQRQSQHRSSGSGLSYRVEGDTSTSSVASCGYYNLQHGTYNSNSHWPSREHSWTSEPSYQWWNSQAAPTFAQSSSTSQPRQHSTANTNSMSASGKSGLSSSSSNKQPSSSSQHSSSRNIHEDQSTCVNLTNSVFDSGTNSVTAPVISLTTSVSSWPTTTHGYSTSGRFGYCAASALFDPPSFNYIRHDAASRKSLPTSTAASTLNSATISSTAGHYSNHYWSSSDWPSSSFPTNSSTNSISNFATNSSATSNFNPGEHSHSGHHQNHGKAQNFQIATMFPEASLPGSNNGGGNWRPIDGYQHGEHGQHSDMFGNTNARVTQGPAYRQVNGDSSCNGVSRFS